MPKPAKIQEKRGRPILDCTTGPEGRPLHAIYLLIDVHTNEVRYVGKTLYPQSRYAEHIRAKSRSAYPVSQWARSLAAEGSAPRMAIVEWTADWDQAERKWIAVLRAEGHPLLNIAAGGLDMCHVGASNKEYRAYGFLLRRLGAMRLREKAVTVKRKAAVVRATGGEGGMTTFNKYLHEWLWQHMPTAAARLMA